MKEKRIIETELMPYFRELVEESVSRQNLKVTDCSRFYIVNLLSDFAKTEKLFDIKDGRNDETPLALILANALNSDFNKKVRAFKKLGDISLYMAGYFSEHIDPKQIDVKYYISMGEGAYKNLAGIFVSDKTFYTLYEELSEKFVDFLFILSDVRNSEGITTNMDLIRIYERWLKTGDSRLEEILKKEGIDIDRTREIS